MRLKVVVDEYEFSSEGIIRTFHPNMGNGIEFTTLSPADEGQLQKLIAALQGEHSEPACQSQIPSVNRQYLIDIPLEMKFNALMSLLQRKGLLQEDDLLNELKPIQQRTKLD